MGQVKTKKVTKVSQQLVARMLFKKQPLVMFSRNRLTTQRVEDGKGVLTAGEKKMSTKFVKVLFLQKKTEKVKNK